MYHLLFFLYVLLQVTRFAIPWDDELKEPIKQELLSPSGSKLMDDVDLDVSEMDAAMEA